MIGTEVYAEMLEQFECTVLLNPVRYVTHQTQRKPEDMKYKVS
jgi:hypothetical protein